MRGRRRSSGSRTPTRSCSRGCCSRRASPPTASARGRSSSPASRRSPAGASPRRSRPTPARSLAARLAPPAAGLIGAQALLGVGAALVLPTSLSLLSQVFEDPTRRVRAVGVWAAGSTVSFAAGPVLGGVLIEQAGWRSIFVINLPLALLAAALVLSQVRGARAAEVAK